MKKYVILYIALFIGCRAFCQDINFSSNDKICFVGNSITMNGGFYHNIALFYATRYPDKPLVILNKGINGNGTADVIKRMDYDILAEQPTWCVIKLGMNDVIRELYLPETVKDAHNQEQRRQAFYTYKKNIRVIIDTLLKHHIKVILQTPTIYDQTSTMSSINLKGRNDALKEFAQYIMETGEIMQLKTIDYWDPMFEINNRAQAADPAATIIGNDRVHPGGVGHFIMTYEFLKGINESASVSKIIINNTRQQTAKAGEHYTLNNFERKKDQIKFTCLEKSLPFPVPDDAEKALTLVPFTQSFNVEMLKVNNLAVGMYTLKIDNVLIGTFAANTLTVGLNLAQVTHAPQYQQALAVLALFKKYWLIEAEQREYCLRKFQKAYQNTSATTTTAILEKSEQENKWQDDLNTIRDSIYQINKPVAHTFLIQKIKS